MSYPFGMILALIFTGTVLGALFLPTREARELAWTGAAVFGFWTILVAILA